DSISKDGYGGGHKCKYGKCCKGPHCHGADEETQATDTTTVAHTEVNGQVENTDTVHEDGYGGGHKCKHGKCCKGPHCHGADDQVENTNTVHEDGYGGGHKCKYGKCCKGPHCHGAADQEVDTNTVHEDGYGGGHKCKYGKCCKGPHCHHESEENNHN
ncbi:hypothetical protein Leryth_014922, partial [Lithospermum erythrorhizon]